MTKHTALDHLEKGTALVAFSIKDVLQTSKNGFLIKLDSEYYDDGNEINIISDVCVPLK